MTGFGVRVECGAFKVSCTHFWFQRCAKLTGSLWGPRCRADRPKRARNEHVSRCSTASLLHRKHRQAYAILGKGSLCNLRFFPDSVSTTNKLQRKRGQADATAGAFWTKIALSPRCGRDSKLPSLFDFRARDG